jgi:hypothetical protein
MQILKLISRQEPEGNNKVHNAIMKVSEEGNKDYPSGRSLKPIVL